MSKKYYIVCSSVSVLAIGLATFLSASRAQELQVPNAPHPEALEQGPIHEAFAEPLALDGQAPEIVPHEPPEPIEELPPEVRPEGRNVQWISGYFQWQEDLQDFAWVSGFYRDIPPGREWVPGTWLEVEGGWQWSPGFWAEGNVEELQYLPVPPATLEQGPSSPAPGDNYLWAPGCWQWHAGGYAWQTGYWYAARPDWVWIPSHYVYAPRGFVYVRGYWDFPFAYRGLLYAPIYWRGGWGAHIGYRYRPSFVLNTSFLSFNLFVGSGYRHYYYGYNNGRPDWVHEWGHGHGGPGRKSYYDPLWTHNDWNKRHGGGDFGRNNFVRDGRRGDVARNESDRGEFQRDGRRGEFNRDGRGLEGQGRDRDRIVTTPEELAKNGDRVKLRRLEGSEVSAERDRAEQFRRSSARRAEVGANDNTQASTTGEIRRRTETGRTNSRARAERVTNANVQAGGQGENRWQRDSSRGASRTRSGADAPAVDNAQARRRAFDGNSATTNTVRREQARARVNSADGSSSRTYGGPSTFAQRGTSTARVPTENSATRTFTPQANYRTLRSQTTSQVVGNVQRRSTQTRSYTPSGNNQQAARIRSMPRSTSGGSSWSGGSSRGRSRSFESSGGGGGGGNFDRRGSSGGGGGGGGGRGGRGRR